MGLLVASGAMTECNFGMAPSVLMVLPANCVVAGGPPAANVMDSVPMLNVLPFIMCKSMANPTVAAATAAALGVLTPMPCIPVTTPWSPGIPAVQIGGQAALDDGSKCTCSWGGSITIKLNTQFQTQV